MMIGITIRREKAAQEIQQGRIDVDRKHAFVALVTGEKIFANADRAFILFRYYELGLKSSRSPGWTRAPCRSPRA